DPARLVSSAASLAYAAFATTAPNAKAMACIRCFRMTIQSSRVCAKIAMFRDIGKALQHDVRQIISLTSRALSAKNRAGPADVAELVDALGLGSSAARRGGSSPLIRTNAPFANA